MKRNEEVMELLEAFDLTHSFQGRRPARRLLCQDRGPLRTGARLRR